VASTFDRCGRTVSLIGREELEIRRTMRAGLRGNPHGINSGRPFARTRGGALGLLLLFPPFQGIVQGCDQLQQLFWIMFATGSFTKLQPALIFEVRHVFLLLMSSPRLQLMDGENAGSMPRLKINSLERRRPFWDGTSFAFRGNFFPGGGAHFSTADCQLSFPEDQKGDVKQLRNGDADDGIGGDLHPSA